MEDNYNSFSDFFKKKITEEPVSDASWTKPDVQRKEEILKQINSIKPSQNGFLRTAIYTFIALLFLGSLGFIAFQHQQLNQLERNLKQEEIQKVELESTLQNKFTEQEKILNKLAEENNVLVEENRDLRNELQIRKQRTNEQDRYIKNLKKEHKQLTASLENILNTKKSHETLTTEILSGHTIQNTQVENTEYEQGTAFFSPKLIEETSFKLIIPDLFLNTTASSSVRRRFEAGYIFGRMDIEIPVSRVFNLQRMVSENIQSNQLFANSHGLQIAWSPVKNLWIRTGIRMASVDMNRHSTLGLAYDKTNERIQPGGSIANELILNTRISFTEIRSSIDITFNRGLLLSQGDLLELNLKDFITLDYVQIPLGIEYFQGFSKLQWILQAGLQWNQINYGDYKFFTSIKARGQAIPVNRGYVLSKDIPASQFYSTYAGIGLDYTFLKQFHLRTAFKYHYNFIKTNASELSNSGKTAMDYELGLHYRF